MNEKDFLQRVDELYKKYAESQQGEIEAFLLKEELYELLLTYKDGDENE
ncbi:hypothetical protein [Lysinibacillus capsici]